MGVDIAQGGQTPADTSVAARRPASEPTPVQSPERILFVTPEIADFVKAGGLGEVSAALPRWLSRQYDVRVLVPGYREVVARSGMRILARLKAAFGLPPCSIGALDTADGLKLFVLICPELYEREGSPYGDTSGRDFVDNDVRFARLSLAAAEIAAGVPGLGWSADLMHLHDWPTALAPAYGAWLGRPKPSVLTIHNLAYQGLFPRESLPRLGVPDESFGMEGVEFYGKLSFLKAGIVYASHVTTVSETYAHEITTPEFGCGLDGLLARRASEGRLTGILNGIDESWDPRSDTHLGCKFSSEDLSGKRANAEEVREEFGLAVSRGPLFAVVSRLVHQKGVDLTIDATESIIRSGGQMVVIGRGEPRFEAAMRQLSARYPGQVGVRIGFEDGIARRIYAGSDFLMMPSRFEPCGLSQMYAQRFGSLPIAHRTGGLADTVEDGVTGFLFREPSLGSLLNAVYRAVDAFKKRRKLNDMRRAAMVRSFAWRRSVREYGEVYARTRTVNRSMAALSRS